MQRGKLVASLPMLLAGEMPELHYQEDSMYGQKGGMRRIPKVLHEILRHTIVPSVVAEDGAIGWSSDVHKARSSDRYDSINWWRLDIHNLGFEPRLIQTLTTVTPLLRWLSTTRARLTSPRRLSCKRIENTSKNR